jgi:hypothetical protein
MVATFCRRDTQRMRPLAVATNLAFIGYGAWAALPPVLALHLLLLPINLWHWVEAPGMDKRRPSDADSIPEGRAGVTARRPRPQR